MYTMARNCVIAMIGMQKYFRSLNGADNGDLWKANICLNERPILPRSNLHDGNDAPTSVEKGSALNLFTSHFNQSFPPLASERLLEKNML